MRALLGRFGTLAALAALVAALSAASPHAFGTLANLVGITQQMTLLALVAIGATAVMAAGEFDLSTGALVSFGGVAAMTLLQAGLPLALALPLVLAGAALAGFGSGLLVARFGVPSFIGTLAVGTMAGGATFWISDGATLLGGVPVGFRELARGTTAGLPTLTWWLAGVAAAVWLLLDRVEFGRRLYAIGGNREAARLAGVPIVRDTALAFALSAALSALAGLLLAARIGSANPTGGGSYLLGAYAAVFLGTTAFREGEANVPGTLVGAALIAVVGNGLTILGASTVLQDILTGAIIIAAVLLRGVGTAAR